MGPCGSCSKNDALRLLRKLVVVGVLSEETFRADNQYGGVMSHLSVCEPVARRLADGALHIRMPFLVCQHMSEISLLPKCCTAEAWDVLLMGTPARKTTLIVDCLIWTQLGRRHAILWPGWQGA